MAGLGRPTDVRVFVEKRFGTMDFHRIA